MTIVSCERLAHRKTLRRQEKVICIAVSPNTKAVHKTGSALDTFLESAFLHTMIRMADAPAIGFSLPKRSRNANIYVHVDTLYSTAEFSVQRSHFKSALQQNFSIYNHTASTVWFCRFPITPSLILDIRTIYVFFVQPLKVFIVLLLFLSVHLYFKILIVKISFNPGPVKGTHKFELSKQKWRKIGVINFHELLYGYKIQVFFKENTFLAELSQDLLPKSLSFQRLAL